ncbi:MAG: helix-hairpin-helix domain-containing protein [Desulfuromonadales bacterium]|nr:helix-hairpin-helix domain-containing protein [Desulfuromonadales bacterium]
MEAEMKELRKIKGIGAVLSRSLVEGGYDTFAKIVAAGEDGLNKIQGVNPGLVGSIIRQSVALAGEMVEEPPKSKAEKIGELKQRLVSLRRQVQAFAFSVHDRYMDQVASKNGKNVERELVKMISTLEMVESRMETRIKKAEKGLTEAEKRFAGLNDAGFKGVGKRLKKARKSLKNVCA